MDGRVEALQSTTSQNCHSNEDLQDQWRQSGSRRTLSNKTSRDTGHWPEVKHFDVSIVVAGDDHSVGVAVTVAEGDAPTVLEKSKIGLWTCLMIYYWQLKHFSGGAYFNDFFSQTYQEISVSNFNVQNSRNIPKNIEHTLCKPSSFHLMLHRMIIFEENKQCCNFSMTITNRIESETQRASNPWPLDHKTLYCIFLCFEWRSRKTRVRIQLEWNLNYPRCRPAAGVPWFHASHGFVLDTDVPNFDPAIPGSSDNFRRPFPDSETADAVQAVDDGLVSLDPVHWPAWQVFEIPNI